MQEFTLSCGNRCHAVWHNTCTKDYNAGRYNKGDENVTYCVHKYDGSKNNIRIKKRACHGWRRCIGLQYLRILYIQQQRLMHWYSFSISNFCLHITPLHLLQPLQGLLLWLNPEPEDPAERSGQGLKDYKQRRHRHCILQRRLAVSRCRLTLTGTLPAPKT